MNKPSNPLEYLCTARPAQSHMGIHVKQLVCRVHRVPYERASSTGTGPEGSDIRPSPRLVRANLCVFVFVPACVHRLADLQEPQISRSPPLPLQENTSLCIQTNRNGIWLPPLRLVLLAGTLPRGYQGEHCCHTSCAQQYASRFVATVTATSVRSSNNLCPRLPSRIPLSATRHYSTIRTCLTPTQQVSLLFTNGRFPITQNGQDGARGRLL